MSSVLGLCFLGWFFGVDSDIILTHQNWLPTPLEQSESPKPEKFRKENQVVVYTQCLIMHRHAQKTEMIDG